MDSLTVRVLAFALPALGIVVSGQSASTQLKTASDAPQVQTRDKDAGISPHTVSIVERLPVVEDAAVASFLDDGKTLISTRGSNELNITTSEDWMSQPRSTVSIIERLPPIEDEIAAALPPATMATAESRSPNLPASSNTAEECHEDEPRSLVALRSDDYVSVSKKFSPDVEEPTTPEITSSDFYRTHLKPEKSTIEAVVDRLAISNLGTIPTPFVKKPTTTARKQIAAPSVGFDVGHPVSTEQVSPAKKVQQPIANEQPVFEELKPELQQPIAASERTLHQSERTIPTADAAPVEERKKIEAAKTDVTPIREESNLPAASKREKFQPSKENSKPSKEIWGPVDLRTVDVATMPSVASRPSIVRATYEDRLQAQKAVRLGFELIQRRANFSARARFVEALRIVARSLDDQTYGTKHTTALQRALTAYEEAGDFFPSTTRPDEDVNLYAVVGSHDTPVFQNVDPQSLNSSQCMREYMAYSEQELLLALGSDELASQALYGLGRLESAAETTSSASEQVRAQRSLTLYQTALVVDNANYSAANELGVMLAKYGRYQEAVVALRHCVQLSPQPTAWRNLSNIYRRLGQSEEARMANIEANRARTASPGTPFVAVKPQVQWVDAQTFASLSPHDANVQVAPVKPQQAVAAPVIPERQPTKTAGKRRLWFLGRK